MCFYLVFVCVPLKVMSYSVVCVCVSLDTSSALESQSLPGGVLYLCVSLLMVSVCSLNVCTPTTGKCVGNLQGVDLEDNMFIFHSSWLSPFFTCSSKTPFYPFGSHVRLMDI